MVQRIDEMAILNIKAKITAIDEGRSGNAAAGWNSRGLYI